MNQFEQDIQLSNAFTPKAIEIYQRIFPDCEYQKVKNLDIDRQLSIDARLVLKSGQVITLQEKYRNYKFIESIPGVHNKFKEINPFPDFTIEFKNAYGTIHENEGEYFKLYAQLYFVGWKNKEGTDFLRYAIFDIARLKIFFENCNINSIGKFCENKAHGKASFYAVSICYLWSCVVYSNFSCWFKE